jgi:hypothetical protein
MKAAAPAESDADMMPDPVPPTPTAAQEPEGQVVTESLPVAHYQPLSEKQHAALPEFADGADISIILVNNRFYPSTIRLRGGSTARLLFTTVNRKPAALVMERLQVQRWIGREDRPPMGISEVEHAKWELTREVGMDRITEIVIHPTDGTYTFHDALSGATGEIIVEK